MKPRLDLLAHQPQRVQHPGLRNLAAAIQLSQDAVETDLLLDLAQPRREAVRFVDQELRRERLVIGQRLEPLDPAHPLHRDLAAGAARRIPPELGLVAEKAHDAVLRLGAGALTGLGEIGWHPQEYLAAARMPRR